MNEPYLSRGLHLEETFFAEREKKLVEELRKLREMEQNIGNLAQVTGIQDKDVLKKFIEIGIRPETAASIAMVPIIEVAWADGEIDEKERAAILKAMVSNQFVGGEIDRKLVEVWLSAKPPAEMLAAWQECVKEVCKSLSSVQKESLKKEISGHARMVAEASGGILGLGNKISESEAAVLKLISESF